MSLAILSNANRCCSESLSNMRQISSLSANNSAADSLSLSYIKSAPVRRVGYYDTQTAVKYAKALRCIPIFQQDVLKFSQIFLLVSISNEFSHINDHFSLLWAEIAEYATNFFSVSF